MTVTNNTAETQYGGSGIYLYGQDTLLEMNGNGTQVIVCGNTARIGGGLLAL